MTFRLRFEWISCHFGQKVRTVVVRSEQKLYFDHHFWVKIIWSEVFKNCICDQVQWSEMTKIFAP